MVPGVGAFAACMAGLRAVRGPQVIDRRLAGGRPVLGICVGMQVLFALGVEHGVQTEGCGEWPGTVERLDAPVLPHIGWNTVEVAEGVDAVRGRGGGAVLLRAQLRCPALGADRTRCRGRAPAVTWARHHDRFVAAVENGPLTATQFHPEKSGDAGAHLLATWVRSLA